MRSSKFWSWSWLVQAGQIAQDWGWATDQRDLGSTTWASWPQESGQAMWSTTSHQRLPSSTPTVSATRPCFLRSGMVLGPEIETYEITKAVFLSLSQHVKPIPDLQVFAVLLHTHLAGRKIRAAHYRWPRCMSKSFACLQFHWSVFLEPNPDRLQFSVMNLWQLHCCFAEMVSKLTFSWWMKTTTLTYSRRSFWETSRQSSRFVLSTSRAAFHAQMSYFHITLSI